MRRAAWRCDAWLAGFVVGSAVLAGRVADRVLGAAQLETGGLVVVALAAAVVAVALAAGGDAVLVAERAADARYFVAVVVAAERLGAPAMSLRFADRRRHHCWPLVVAWLASEQATIPEAGPAC